ncbi:MAG TPA: [protein-PII] uridylyltransferase [Blastocatellia bacterium]|nr:[protein-PII] uridylyltransferase [Blastocatellia bacterium]
MRIDLEKTLIHANEKLSVDSLRGGREVQMAAFKRFLRIETERLKMRHRFGLSGGEIAGGRSYLIDLVVCRACETAAADLEPREIELKTCTAVALGGYGRRDLSPGSDIDILFLHAGRRSEGAKKFAQQVLYLLWDIGLTVGHSFRSVAECVDMSRRDLHSRTAMSEARLITGSQALFRRLNKELAGSVYSNKRDTEAFLASMKAEVDSRYAKFGRTVCMQEPNLKESPGGLRDLHTVLWIGHARFGCGTLDDLRAEDYISGAEYVAARRAYEFMTRARNEAHFLTGRKADVLTLDLQPAIASALGYGSKRGLLFTEVFMRDYYQHAQELNRLCGSFVARAMESKTETRPGPIGGRFEIRQGKLYLTMKQRAGAPSTVADGFEIRGGELFLNDEPADFRSNPMRLMAVFAIAQDRGAALSDDLKQLIRESLPSIGRSFRASKEAGRAFMQILKRSGHVAATLRMMHETGFLGRFVPEFARITFLAQHDSQLSYTIDEHSLRAVEALDRLAEIAGDLAPFREALAEVETPEALYLGVLLHDTGKDPGRRDGSHAARGVRIAQKVCARLGVDAAAAEKVGFVVTHHQLMSHLSLRRDLADQNLLEEFVATTRDLDRLNMLLLLTYADASSVGPGAWNDWKAAQILELYTRARQSLAGSGADQLAELDRSQHEMIQQRVVEELSGECEPGDVERHLAMLPPRYLRATLPAQIISHFRLSRRIERHPALCEWRPLPERRCTELTICARDTAGFFARIAGALTAHGVNILSADLNTRADGVVIDTFNVCEVSSHHPIRQEHWSRIERNLIAAIAGAYDVERALEDWGGRRRGRPARMQPSVRFDQDASAANTVVEVRAEDEPGLAYKIASRLAVLHLNITFAKITTEKRHALDIFYVTDREGKKLAPQALPFVEAQVLEVLGKVAPRMKEAV